jgi:hypothetical protein
MTELTDSDTIEEILSQLLIIEEDWFVAGFDQQVQNACKKAWHEDTVSRRSSR